MKIFYNGKQIRDNAGRFSNFKIRVKNFFKRVMFWSFIAGMVYGAFQIGQMSITPEYTKAAEIVETEFPLLDKICQAESSGRQFREDGKVLRGRVNASDIGICQINEPIWNDKARELGYDIYTEKGNKDMAKWLFVRYGSDPWRASKSIWSK